MGLRFNLSTANWIAHVLDNRSVIPVATNWDEKLKQRDAVLHFANSIEGQLLSSPRRERQFHNLLDLQGLRDMDDQKFADFLLSIREFFADRKWTALIVPSGSDDELDRSLCSQTFLRSLVRIRPDDPGLILQLADPPRKGDILGLEDVFPAFNVALREATSWPGWLLWTPRGDTVFLPFGTMSSRRVEERAHWIVSHLSTVDGLDTQLFERQYLRSIGKSGDEPNRRLTLLQMSDIHLGCRQADHALPRLQQICRNIVRDCGGPSAVLPVISGDLLDDPEEDNHNRFRTFFDAASNLTAYEPILLLGNHDVRRDGYRSRSLEQAIQIPATSRVHWIQEFNLAIVAFNSVIGGKLARGMIGEPQLYDIGSEIDRKRDSDQFSFVGVLHHHPIPVEKPEWYSQPFYERVLGSWFERTDELEDAPLFLEFARQRRFGAIMHGHKHIPRLDKTPGNIPVFGCGSSVGKVNTRDRYPLISVNLITFDRSTNQVSGRLLVEGIPGGGLRDYHTLMCKWSGQSAASTSSGA